MTNDARRERFEQLLTDEAYSLAWRYSCRLCTAGAVVLREDAEDLLQESLAHAYRHLHQLREPASFKGWLLSIIRTQLINRRRAARGSWLSVEDLPELADGAATSAGDPLAGEMLAALTQLPVAQRELLSLFYIEGLSLKETGQVLRIAPRVVRQRLLRAREALRRRLRPPRAARLSEVRVHPSSSKGVIQ